MQINSSYYITLYKGNAPLPLKNKPAVFDADAKKNLQIAAQYDKFIQSIGTIYDSQSINGKIPKFWTKLAETTDPLGNRKYTYVPHPDSDLENLTPNVSYYFIVRDDSVLPLDIPPVSGLKPEYSELQMPPNILSVSIPNIVLSGVAKHTIQPVITNLIPYQQYEYEFQSVNSNWPISISNRSGILLPSNESGTIQTNIRFCPTTGNCDTNILPHILPQTCTPASLDNKSITMRLSIKLPAKNIDVLSNQFSIECQDCLPKPMIKIVPKSALTIREPITDSDPVASFMFDLQTENLVLNTLYNYEIETVRSEWPFILTIPASGSFTLKSSTDQPSLYGSLFFCPDTSLCLPGVDGVSQYDVPIYPSFLKDNIQYITTLRAKLTTSECAADPVYSLPITLLYQN